MPKYASKAQRIHVGNGQYVSVLFIIPVIIDVHRHRFEIYTLQEEYLDVYEGILSEIVNTTRFDENLDLSTTYLGMSNRAKSYKLKAEDSFPISEQGYTLGKLLDGTECQLLSHTDTRKSFMSKSYYM